MDVDLKFRSQINALVPRALQTTRLILNNLRTQRGITGLELNETTLPPAHKLTAFDAQSKRPGESTINFGARLDESLAVRASKLNHNPLEYSPMGGGAKPITLSDTQYDTTRLLLLLTTLDFNFKLEVLKSNLKGAFKDPLNLWSNFTNNVFEPLKTQTSDLLMRIKDLDKSDALSTLISEAQKLSVIWINTLHNQGNKFISPSIHGNPTLLTELMTVKDLDTRSQWEKLLQPSKQTAKPG